MGTAFETEMGVMPELSKAVMEMDWILPTDIQGEAVPLILGGGDVLMAAETGSGKTGAFCLPVLQIVYETLKDMQSGKHGKHHLSSSGAKSHCRLNAYDRTDAMAIDSDGFLCQSRDPAGWHGARANRGVKNSELIGDVALSMMKLNEMPGGLHPAWTRALRVPAAYLIHVGRCGLLLWGPNGRYYYEVTVTDEGLCRVGWSTLRASHDIGTDAESFGFGGTGKMSHRRQFDSYGESFGKGDTIGCFLDLENKTISWSKNGTDFGKAYDVPPALCSTGLFPCVCLKNAEVRLNFGDSPFVHNPPSGWLPVGAAEGANIVESTFTGSSVAGQSAPKPNAPLALIMEVRRYGLQLPNTAFAKTDKRTSTPLTSILSHFPQRHQPPVFVEPSRELAEQTCEQIRKFKRYLKDPCPRELLVVGGANSKQQLDALYNGVDIVVATPGRLDDLISSGSLLLSNCRFFILDECDGLLSAGYGDMITRLHNHIPKVSADGARLQMVVCSATLHSFDVKKLANKLMHFPVWIDLKGQDSVPETVHHVVCNVDPIADQSWKQLWNSRDRIQTDGVHMKDGCNPGDQSPETLSEAVKILKGEYVIRAIRNQKMDRALIFCRTKLDCDNLEQRFVALGGGPNRRDSALSCVCLHSDRAPAERKSNLQKFKNGDVRFLICTDVAARGIDIAGLPYVINMTLPDEKQNYVHRIGRVGRAERMGLAISLVSTAKEKVWYHSNCSTRGRGCYNTRLVEQGGCCIWYNEPQLLADIEEHLGVTIDTVDSNLVVPSDAFDGKVVYGQKLKQLAPKYKSHVDVLASAVKELNQLEKRSQQSYLRLKYGGEITA